MPFRNFYRCAKCGSEWAEIWSLRRDDECPRCSARRISPYASEDIGALEKVSTVAVLNDAFRRTFAGGRVLMTVGVAELPDMVKAEAFQRVARFEDFFEDNDPHGEHDFGAFELCSRRFFWKIDYYDKACEGGSENPADPAKTLRVLTVMLAEEY